MKRALMVLAVGMAASGLNAAESYVVEPGKGPEKPEWAKDVLAYADPFIGSGGTGHTTPAAAYPFGMVQPGPDTGHEGWERCSGYQYGDKTIKRFSQNHLSGTGCSEFTDLGFMPAAGDPGQALGRDYHSRIDKSLEKASPGYYAVTLECGTKVEATCTRHVSLFRFTYPKGAKASLLFDPSWSFREIKSAKISPMDQRRVTGYIDRHGWPGHDLHFAWEISEQPVSSRIVGHVGKAKVPKSVYEFDLKNGNVVYLKVALSRTSAEGARRSIDIEVPGWDFDAVHKANRAAWRGILERVKAKGTRDQLRSLYTSIYHLCFQPNLISDAGEEDIYSTFSCWDTYRAAGPLYTILTPEYVPRFINSMIWHFDQNGFLPVWTLWGKDNQCMIGVHSVPMIIDAYFKGFKGVDWSKAYECVRKTLRENLGRDKANYHILDKYGYYPFDIVRHESVSRLLESCYDDACAARMAKSIGNFADAAFFRNRSRTWTNCFDSATGFIRGRDSKGAWRDPFDPYLVSHIVNCDYTEGNAFHWNWHVMQDPELLISLIGGKEKAVKRLDGLFSEDSSKAAGVLPDVTGLIGQYCHGNEPSHHDIYFFSLLGRRDLTSKYIRKVLDTQYFTSPDGLCGNDDCGQMSAWYIFAAMGLYPFDPCGKGYVLGEAQIKELSIDVGNGRRFRVVSENPGGTSKTVELNGRRLDGVVIAHEDIMKGATLSFKGRVEEAKSPYDYVFDVSAAPEMMDWTRKELAPAVRTWYPRIVDAISSPEAAPKKVTIAFKSGIGCPAYCVGTKVVLDTQWIKNNPYDIGSAIHELVHVVQNGYRNAPGWICEGIADYVRFYIYEPESNGTVLDVKDLRYDGSYRVSASFLAFVEKKHPGTVKELNGLCHRGRYDGDTFWRRRTGKGVEDLAKEWKSLWRAPYSSYRFCVDATKGNADCMQISELELLDGNGRVIPRERFELRFNDNGYGSRIFGSGETPDKAVDGNTDTKWLDFRSGSPVAEARAAVWLRFDFGKPTALSGYRWYTANDFDERDPSAWRLMGSGDGVVWTQIDAQRGFNAPRDRNKAAFERKLAK